MGALDVFAEDPGLLDDVPADQRATLDRLGRVRGVSVSEGRWMPSEGHPVDALGVLVIDGLMVRTTRVLQHETPELLGAGDLLRPWDVDAPTADSGWQVLRRARLAMLDAGFAARVARWPAITSVLLARAIERSRGQAFLATLGHVRCAGDRLVLLLWHLADRWGVVRPDGVLVPLELTHAMLGQMACMRRPTATSTLNELMTAAVIARVPEGWLLLGEPPSLQA